MKLTETQIEVLQRIAKHGTHRAGLTSTHEHTVATKARFQLVRLRLVKWSGLTDAGRKALAETEVKP